MTPTHLVQYSQGLVVSDSSYKWMLQQAIGRQSARRNLHQTLGNNIAEMLRPVMEEHSMSPQTYQPATQPTICWGQQGWEAPS